jgi:hypothetical protein
MNKARLRSYHSFIKSRLADWEQRLEEELQYQNRSTNETEQFITDTSVFYLAKMVELLKEQVKTIAEKREAYK